MKNQPLLTRQALLSLFLKNQTATEKIGMEVELGVVDPNTGISIAYEATNGFRAILEALMKTDDWTPIYEDELLLGLVRADETKVILEPGGQLEYASAPAKDLVELIERMRQVVLSIAEVARGLGTALIAGSMLPFDKPEDAKWIPKPRYLPKYFFIFDLKGTFRLQLGGRN